MTARRLALDALHEWRQGRQFADAIIQRLLAETNLTASDRGFAVELFYGVLRNLSLLDFWIQHLRQDSLDHESRDLLRLGLYQLFCLRTPGHAAVFETVTLSGRHNRGLINGILRAAIRREAELLAASETQPPHVRFSHPEFLIKRWSKGFGQESATALCQWDNQPPPIYARINTLREGIAPFGEPVAGKDYFVCVDDVPYQAIERGDCYIQDPSTAMSCAMLDPQPGETVLDACAAPGGKTSLLAQGMNNRGLLVACDREPARVALLEENMRRLGLNAIVLRHDWKTGAPKDIAVFDRILLDAPCSNTGVIRRRVDARWRLTSNDFLRMQAEQLAILRALVPLLRPGGVLVYSTCSLEAEENEQLVQKALVEFPFLRLEAEEATLPFRDQFDGAFAARLIRDR